MSDNQESPAMIVIDAIAAVAAVAFAVLILLDVMPHL